MHIPVNLFKLSAASPLSAHTHMVHSTSLNYSQHKASLQSCSTSNLLRDLFPLLTVSPPPLLHRSLPPCLPQRFAVLQMSLAPCSFCPTSLSAAKSIFEDNLRCAAPWWLGFDATAPPSVPPTLKNLPRTDSHVTAI